MTETRTDPMVWTYNGQSVFFDPETEMGSLTTMWEAVGRPETKRPNFWTESAQAKEIIAALAQNLNARNSCILETRRGRDGGTWAHWQIATVYAHYLDPRFYLWWNEQARAHIEGRATPAEFGQFLSQLMELCDGAEAKVARVRKLAQELGQAVYELPQELEALRVMIPAVNSQQIADPATIGYVYVLRVNGSNEYKIGQTSKTVEERKKKLAGPLGTRLEDIAVVMTDDPGLLESRIQGFYKRKRVQGKREMFHLSELDIERIQGLDDFVTAGLFDPAILAVYEQKAF